MSNDTRKPNNSETPPKGKLKAAVSKTAEVADKASNVAEVANNAFSAVKWVAIAIVMLTALGFGYGAYKLVTKPVIAVTDAAGKMVDVASDGAGALKDSAGNVVNRLIIPTQDQAALNVLAETGFSLLHTYPVTKADGMKERLFRATNFGDSEKKVCKMSVNFGGGDLDAYGGVNNEDYAKSKSLGSKDNRLIRFILRAGRDDIPLNVVWDNDASHWQMKWRPTTVKKPLDDTTAESRIFDMLREVQTQCKGGA
ncbi:MAG: hypothetical protein L3J65_00500 [Robiginitomaculum sp.]|nr:hypothetical protein [Robiginitomaculum sp.]